MIRLFLANFFAPFKPFLETRFFKKIDAILPCGKDVLAVVVVIVVDAVNSHEWSIMEVGMDEKERTDSGKKEIIISSIGCECNQSLLKRPDGSASFKQGMTTRVRRRPKSILCVYVVIVTPYGYHMGLAMATRD